MPKGRRAARAQVACTAAAVLLTHPAWAQTPERLMHQPAQALPWLGIMLLWLAGGVWAWLRLPLQQRQGAKGPARPPLSRWPAAVTAACLVLLALLGWMVADNSSPGHALLLAWDQAMQLWPQTHVQGALRTGLHRLTDLGDVRWLCALALLVAMWLAACRQWLVLQTWVFAIVLAGLATQVLKNGIARGRPEALYEIFTSGASFPSGHTSGAVVVYGLLWLVARPWLPARWHRAAGFGVVVLVAAVAASRIWLEAHFATDVAAGALLGLAILCGSALALQRGGRSSGLKPD